MTRDMYVWEFNTTNMGTSSGYIPERFTFIVFRIGASALIHVWTHGAWDTLFYPDDDKYASHKLIPKDAAIKVENKYSTPSGHAPVPVYINYTFFENREVQTYSSIIADKDIQYRLPILPDNYLANCENSFDLSSKRILLYAETRNRDDLRLLDCNIFPFLKFTDSHAPSWLPLVYVKQFTREVYKQNYTAY